VAPALGLAVSLPLAASAAVFPGAVQFATNAYFWTENTSPGGVTVTRSGNTSSNASVQWQAIGGSAAPGIDYSPTNGVVTFAAGQVTQNFSLVILSTNLLTNDLTLLLALTNPVGTTLGSPSSAIVTIQPPVFYISGSVLLNGSGFGGVAMNLTGPHPASVFTDWSGYYFFSNTPAANYVLTPSAPGYQFSPPSLTYQPLSNYVYGGFTATPTNFSLPLVQFTNFSAGQLESGGAATLTVQRLRNTAGTVSVQWNTGTGTAMPGVNYVPTNGVLTFGPGVTTRNISVPVLDDGVPNPALYVPINLYSPVGAMLGTNSSALLFIFDMDYPVTAEFASSYGYATEMNGPTRLTVQRRGNIFAPFSVDWAITGGTAMPGIDFTNPLSGTLVFNSGILFQYVEIDLVDDYGSDETYETVNLELRNPTNAVLGGISSMVLTIADYDTPPLADLQLSQSVVPSAPLVGQNLIYSVTVSNAGPNRATNIVVSDSAPAGTSFVSVGSDIGISTYDPFANSVQWILDELLAYSSATMTLEIQATNSGIVSNTAFVTSDTPDPDLGNNSATLNVPVTSGSPQTDVGVSIATSAGVAYPGSNFTYTLTVANLGPSAASGVVLYDSLPPDFTLASAYSSQGSVSNNGIDVTAHLNSLAPGGTATITLAGTASGLGTLLNVATVNINETDMNPLNDMAQATTPVARPPLLLSQPSSIRLPCGDLARLTAAASGTPPLTYQWFRDSSPVPGATDDTLDLGPVGGADNGRQYYVQVSNGFGQTTSTNITLSVLDSEPPSLLCPDTIVVPCAGQGGTPVTFTVEAWDNCDPNVVAVCAPPSGSLFQLGTNWVQCGAVDASGNSNSCAFAVVVINTQPPIIQVPGPILVNCATQGGSTVSFTVTAASACDPNVTLVCQPPSGALFPIGETLVECVGTDSSGNTSTAEFLVTVIDPVPVPLSIVEQGTNIVICWPVACQAYQLYWSHELGAGAYWLPVPLPDPLPIVNNQYCIVLPRLPVNAFFQLQGKPTLNSVVAKADGKLETLQNLTKPVAFTAEVTSQNCNGATFAWDFGDGSTSTQQNPSHAYATNGVFTARVTVTCAADPTQTKSATVKVIVPAVQIVREDGTTPLSSPETNIVAIQTIFKTRVIPPEAAPALAGGSKHWYLGANDPPRKDVAISIFTNLLYTTSGRPRTQGAKQLDASEVQQNTLKLFFTKAQDVTLRYEITKDGKIFVAQAPLRNVYDPDPNRNIYARTDEGSAANPAVGAPDARRNPNGIGGIYKVTAQHKIWHWDDDGSMDKYGEADARRIAGLAPPPSASSFDGRKWFDYHAAMIAAFTNWCGTFNITNGVDKTRGPALPTYFTAAGAALPAAVYTSPVFKYVRLDEYPDDNQLGVDIHPWHAAGHSNRELDTTTGGISSTALPAARSLPGINTPLNNVSAANNIFWAWHGKIEDFRQGVVFTLTNGLPSPAMKTATAPTNGAVVPKGLSTIIIVFDRPVSINGPSSSNPRRANNACARDNSLRLVSPGGITNLSTKVEWDGGDPKRLKFTVPKLEAAGQWNINLPGTARGFIDVNLQITIR
jgi:uncharacterized repeat protein (TIGR01451 family)